MKRMSLSAREVYLYPRHGRFSRPPGMRGAVSLHSHSDCSRETLEFIPRFASSIPIIASCYERSLVQYEREHGRPLKFGDWYFRPPVSPAAVIDSEKTQLEQRLDLRGLVSLTDHDTVEGPLQLRANGSPNVPLSFEWSVPFERSLFHFGVHGIPPGSIDATMRALTAYTAGPRVDEGRWLGELLDHLAECPETLIVLNHPCWDLARIGQLRHDAALLALLRHHRDRIHALELNGYRTWAENRCVLPLATGFGIPVVGGGDRHGLTPNAIVNMTRASDLGEFAHELRVERFSCCVVFPEYADPFVGRVLQTVADVVGSHDRQQGRTTWDERVFIEMNGTEQSVASMWKREPLWLRSALAVTRAIAAKPFTRVFELTRADGHETLEADCRSESLVEVSPLSTDSAAAA
jgi:hypothetical protein